MTNVRSLAREAAAARRAVALGRIGTSLNGSSRDVPPAGPRRVRAVGARLAAPGSRRPAAGACVPPLASRAGAPACLAHLRPRR